MTDQSRTNRYTTDSRGERTPMPHVLRPANPNSPAHPRLLNPLHEFTVSTINRLVNAIAPSPLRP